jgi:hypothetical protein
VGQNKWVQTTAAVFSCGWQNTPAQAFIFRNPADLLSGNYLVVFSYTIDGHYYSGEFTSSKEYQEGETIDIFYNPENPEQNNLTFSSSWKGKVITYAVGILLFALYIWWKDFRK